MGIGKKIKGLVKEKDISLRQLASQAGIPYNTLYSIVERDSERVKLETVRKIAEALEVAPTDLLYDEPATSFSQLHQRIIENGGSAPFKIILEGQDKEQMDRITAAFINLNGKGKKKSVEYIEDLVKIDEYKKD